MQPGVVADERKKERGVCDDVHALPAQQKARDQRGRGARRDHDVVAVGDEVRCGARDAGLLVHVRALAVGNVDVQGEHAAPVLSQNEPLRRERLEVGSDRHLRHVEMPAQFADGEFGPLHQQLDDLLLTIAFLCHHDSSVIHVVGGVGAGAAVQNDEPRVQPLRFEDRFCLHPVRRHTPRLPTSRCKDTEVFCPEQ